MSRINVWISQQLDDEMETRGLKGKINMSNLFQQALRDEFVRIEQEIIRKEFLKKAHHYGI